MCQTKVCTKCGVEKNTSDFQKCRTTSSGIGSRCKSCVNEYSRNWVKRRCVDESIKSKQCPKCGVEKDLAMFGNQRLGKHGVSTYCRECKDFMDAEYRKNNREKCRQSIKRHIAKDPERYRVLNNDYKSKNRYKWRASELACSKRYISDLRTPYVREKLIRGSGLDRASIPQELIDLKRAELMIKRQLKEMQNGK